ncbi:MAG: hypothetical protein BWX74_00122 [Tenericutes bacterium ADurb.Bin087]|jgi:hypothetical protein|nr:MAG: hypothetical protein BWX74_00122 [Tenericutes bacterium ADurb.Bin087]
MTANNKEDTSYNFTEEGYSYRLDRLVGVYRYDTKVFEEFDFKTRQWKQTVAAFDAFYEGGTSYLATREEVEVYIIRAFERLGNRDDL